MGRPCAPHTAQPIVGDQTDRFGFPGNGLEIARADTRGPLCVAARLEARYGGSAADYAKVTSKGFGDGLDPYDLFETQWHENVATGERFELKTKFPRAEGSLEDGL